MIPEPTFELREELQTWAATLHQGKREFAVAVTRYADGTMTLSTWNSRDFTFVHSQPNVVLAIGRLLVAAARKCGATDA